MVLNVEDSEYRALAPDESKADLPRISYDMRDHQLAIIITWSIIFVTGGVLPVVLYFALRYAAKLELSTSTFHIAQLTNCRFLTDILQRWQ